METKKTIYLTEFMESVLEKISQYKKLKKKHLYLSSKALNAKEYKLAIVNAEIVIICDITINKLQTMFKNLAARSMTNNN
jgi:hypothetical protein